MSASDTSGRYFHQGYQQGWFLPEGQGAVGRRLLEARSLQDRSGVQAAAVLHHKHEVT